MECQRPRCGHKCSDSHGKTIGDALDNLVDCIFFGFAGIAFAYLVGWI